MYRIMIVDDDMIVRMYLKDMIQREDYGFCVSETARDGVEALELIKKEIPDVILTDISMPRMDGIEFIERVRKEGYQGVINVLSCHDDFDYVRRAMQLGADDYLLKNHLNADAMNDVMKKMEQQIQERVDKFGEKNEIDHLIHKGIDLVQREFLEQILLKGSPFEVSEVQLREAKLSKSYKQLTAIMLLAERADKNQVRELKSLYMQKMDGESVDLMLLNDSLMVLLIDLTNIPSTAKCQEKTGRLQVMILHIAKEYLNLNVSMASSAICSGKTGVSEAILQADNVLKNRFYGEGCWTYQHNSVFSEQLPERAISFSEKILKLIADENVLRREFFNAYKAIREVRVIPENVHEWFQKLNQRLGISYKKQFYFEDYQGLIEEYVLWGRNHSLPDIPNHLSPAVKRAVQYVQKHYCETIGLNEAANEAELSMAYFSTIFKKEMGIGFSEYLVNLRLERVCTRFRTSSASIKEIAEESGFCDYPHFCRIFKKHYGVSPASYRKTCAIF